MVKKEFVEIDGCYMEGLDVSFPSPNEIKIGSGKLCFMSSGGKEVVHSYEETTVSIEFDNELDSVVDIYLCEGGEFDGEQTFITNEPPNYTGSKKPLHLFISIFIPKGITDISSASGYIRYLTNGLGGTSE